MGYLNIPNLGFLFGAVGQLSFFAALFPLAPGQLVYLLFTALGLFPVIRYIRYCRYLKRSEHKLTPRPALL
jgi:hypothetical protein